MNPFVIALLCLLGLVVLLLLIAIIRTVLLKGVQKERKPVQLDQDIQKKYALGLSELLKFRTIASRNDYDLRPFKDMQSAMKGLFPNVFSTMEITYIDKASILARWVGLDSTLKPLILMAHQDVVPAPKEGWVHDPFSGLIDASEVHGRGAFDTKCTLYAFFQAAEELISEELSPKPMFI